MVNDIEIWIPPGDWVEETTGLVMQGDSFVRWPYDLSEIPVFFKSGAIIPM